MSLKNTYRKTSLQDLENRNLLTTFVAQEPFLTDTEVSGAMVSVVADLDEDGDADIATAFGGSVFWYENLGETFASEIEIAAGVGTVLSLIAVDADADGDMDLISGSPAIRDNAGHLNLYSFEDGEFGLPQSLLVEEVAGASYVVAGDVDGDGDDDLLLSQIDAPDLQGGISFVRDENGRIQIQLPEITGTTIWLSNEGGEFEFGGVLIQKPTRAAFTGDLNGDGLLDIVTTRHDFDGPLTGIDDLLGGGLPSGDSLGNGDLRGSVGYQGQLAEVHLNSEDGFAEPVLVIDEAIRQLDLVDTNQDGALDLVVTPFSAGNDNLVGPPPVGSLDVFANDGDGGFAEAEIIALPGEVVSYAIADIDVDGIPDVVAIQGQWVEEQVALALEDSTLVWFDWSPAGVSDANVILETQGDLGVADFDGDGDTDLLLVDHGFASQIQWIVNQTPIPEFPEGDINRDGVVDADDIDLLFDRIGSDDTVADLNGDGQVALSDVDYLVEDILGTTRGDTNLDGTVDFQDFLLLSQGFGQSDASWSSGDFDGNGLVEFADFLLLAWHFGGN